MNSKISFACIFSLCLICSYFVLEVRNLNNILFKRFDS